MKALIAELKRRVDVSRSGLLKLSLPAKAAIEMADASYHIAAFETAVNNFTEVLDQQILYTSRGQKQSGGKCRPYLRLVSKR